MKFACIILAAGEGARIGKCKAALPFGESGESLLSHLINTYMNCGINDILVITGNWKEETKSAAQRFSSLVRFINNDNPQMGMFSSVCKGVSLLDKYIEYFFVHPVDIPLVKEDTVLKMKNAILCSKSNIKWIVPECKNEEGHPVLISASLVPELVAWKGKRGLRGFLSIHENDKIIEYVDDEGTIIDIDYQEDFAKLSKIIMDNKLS